MLKSSEPLEPFSIKCRGIEWCEIKKGIDFLRSNGIKVQKRKNTPPSLRDAYCLVFSPNQMFERARKHFREEHLILPRDWYKLVTYVEKYNNQ
jgi:hypothetical protein